MAINKLHEYLDKKVKPQVEAIHREELSKEFVESYVFRRELVLEYVDELLSLSGSASGTFNKTKIYSAFMRKLKHIIRFDTGKPYHIHIHKGMTITKMRGTAGYENNGAIRKAIRGAKDAALNEVEKQMGRAFPQKAKAKVEGTGHHGDIELYDAQGNPTRKTTLGAVQLKKRFTQMLPVGKSGSLSQQLIDLAEYNQEEDKIPDLCDIVIQQMDQVLDIELGLLQPPQPTTFKSMVAQSRQFGRKPEWIKRTIQLGSSDIQIVFGVGRNAQGKAYTAAMTDWDAGRRGKGDLGKTIDLIVFKAVARISNLLKNLGLQDAVDAATRSGSQSPAEKLTLLSKKALIQGLFPHKTNPDMRLSVNKALLNDKIEVGGKKHVKSTIGGKRKARTTKGKVKKASASTGIAGLRTNPQSNPMALRNLLNAALSKAVAKNMTAPALRFRTGRLANSVRIDNITTGPRGGNMLVEATYQTDPYGTYAPGGKRYTRQRDPERLIKGSIREIASGIIGQRFSIEVDR